jgi:tetratricopeptide (TPR) repeat protein
MTKRKTRISVSPPAIDSVTFKHLNELHKNHKKVDQYDIDLVFCILKIRDLPMQMTPYCENLPMVYANEYDSLYDFLDEEKFEEAIVGFQNLIYKVPNLPLVYIELSTQLHFLKRYEEATRVISESYSKFKGLPLIDAIYAKTLDTDKADFITNELFKGSINLHEVYPHREDFLTKEAIDFYKVLTTVYLDLKKYDKAELCLNALAKFDPKGDDTIRLRARYFRLVNPIRAYSYLMLTISLVLAILALILWGVYKFFAWIF